MEISEISNKQVIQLMRQTLDLPHADKPMLDETLIAASIRRVAAFSCPCSQTTLLNTLIAALLPLVDDEQALIGYLEEGINKLFITGDLLEFTDVSIGDINAKGTWIFAAPPGFMSRANGNIFLFGLTPDENSAIPSLSSRIIYQGYKRILKKNENEDLESTLQDLGLVQVSEKAWLKLPKLVAPDRYFSDLKEKLAVITTAKGDIDDLEILDYNLTYSYYRERWVVPARQTGIFVGRRTQAFGSAVWGLFEMEGGVVVNFFDLPLSVNGIQQRGCDTGWHCQLAIDHMRGQPQRFGMGPCGDGMYFEFFSPIPLWAERRLSAIGHSMQSTKGLLSYFIPQDEVQTEEKFLLEYLWMKPLS